MVDSSLVRETTAAHETYLFYAFVIITCLYLFCSMYSLRWSWIQLLLQEEEPSCRSCTRLGRPHAIGTFLSASFLCRTAWATVKAVESMERKNARYVHSHRHTATKNSASMNTNGPFYRCLNRLAMLLMFTACSIVVERWYASHYQTSRPGSLLCGSINFLLYTVTFVVEFIQGRIAYMVSTLLIAYSTLGLAIVFARAALLVRTKLLRIAKTRIIIKTLSSVQNVTFIILSCFSLRCMLFTVSSFAENPFGGGFCCAF